MSYYWFVYKSNNFCHLAYKLGIKKLVTGFRQITKFVWIPNCQRIGYSVPLQWTLGCANLNDYVPVGVNIVGIPSVLFILSFSGQRPSTTWITLYICCCVCTCLAALSAIKMRRYVRWDAMCAGVMNAKVVESSQLQILFKARFRVPAYWHYFVTSSILQGYM